MDATGFFKPGEGFEPLAKPPTPMATTVGLNVESRAWGVLGTACNHDSLERILRIAGHNAIRSINRNGRALANRWLKDGQDGRAKAVEGSSLSWKAFETLRGMVSHKTHYRDPPVHTHGDSEVLIEMAQAAFGKSVVTGYVDYICSRYYAAIAAGNIIVLLGVIILDGIDTSDSGLISLMPRYDLKGTFIDINAIPRDLPLSHGHSTVEAMITSTIADVLNLREEYRKGVDTLSLHTNFSLVHILPPASMRSVLDQGELEHLARGYISSEVFTAYASSTHLPTGYPTRIDGTITHPEYEGMFSVALWKDGPLFCVVNNGTYAFRTLDFPAFHARTFDNN
jgi:hypothetical protein